MALEDEVRQLADEAVHELAGDSFEGDRTYVVRLVVDPWDFGEEAVDETVLPVLEELGCAGCVIEADGALVVRSQIVLEDTETPKLVHARLAKALHELGVGHVITTNWTKIGPWEQSFSSEMVLTETE